jgi:hypothetical protein
MTSDAGDVIRTTATSLENNPGDTFTAGGTTAMRLLPVIATVEPDADKDGFGDETQDKCATDATTQADCDKLAPKLAIFNIPGTLQLLIVTDQEASITVAGSANVPAAKRKRRKRARATKAVALTSVSRSLAIGQLGNFTLATPKAVKSALRKLTRRKSIKVELTITAKDTKGNTATTKQTVSLKGTAKRRKARR